MPRINIFNGGLRTAQAPNLIKENESTVYDNTNHITGILEPIKDKIQAIAGASKYGHFFTSSLVWYWSATPKDYVELQERLYIGNRTGISTKIVNGVEYNMGIQQPTAIPTIVVSGETPEQDQTTRLGLVTATDAAGDIPADVLLKYKVVNINAAGEKYPWDVEFNIQVLSDLDKADANYNKNTITVTCTDTNISSTIAIFRFFDNYWRLIYEGVSIIPTFIDNTYDISASVDDIGYEVTGLKGTYQYALTFFNSLDGTESVPVLSDEFEIDWGTATVSNLEISTDLQVDQRKLYRIGGASTAFTLVETIDNTITSYVDNFKDDELEGSLLQSEQNFPPVANLQHMMESYAMLFAADKDKLRFTPIGEPDYWPQTYYLDFPRTITGLAKTPIGVLVFNQYETWLVTGTGPLSLSQQLLTGSQGCINGDSVVNIEGSALWASTDGICMSNGGVVGVITNDKLSKIDLTDSINAVVHDEQYYLLKAELGESLILDLSRQIIRTADYNVRSFIVANDTLYGYNADNLHEINANINNLQMYYSSPEYVGRGYTILKTYKNFYMFSEGNVTIEIFINGVLIQTATEITYDNHQIKIPSNCSKGYVLYFNIYGTGTVYEIQWEEGDANK